MWINITVVVVVTIFDVVTHFYVTDPDSASKMSETGTENSEAVCTIILFDQKEGKTFIKGCKFLLILFTGFSNAAHLWGD